MIHCRLLMILISSCILMWHPPIYPERGLPLQSGPSQDQLAMIELSTGASVVCCAALKHGCHSPRWSLKLLLV